MLVTSADQLSVLKVRMLSKREVAYDIESTGVNVRKDQIIGFAVGGTDWAAYIAHQVWNAEKQEMDVLISKQDCAAFLEWLRRFKLVTFNGSFDMRFTMNYFGVHLLPALWSEVQLARHTSDENLSPWDGLKDIAASLFGADVKAEQADLVESIKANGGTESEFYKASLDVLAKYAMQDVMLTMRLNEHFLADLKKQNLLKFFFDDEVMPLYREVTVPMEHKGIRLNMPLMRRAHASISAEIEQLDRQIRDLVQPHLGSFERWFLDKQYPPKRSGEFAQEVCRLLDAPLPLTKSGNYSLAAAAIEALPDGTLKGFLTGTSRLPDPLVALAQKNLQGREPMFNLQSKHHWKKVFFEELGETPLSYTETGQPQADDEFLYSIRDKYQFVPLLIEYNKLNKIKSTYIERFLNAQEDGRFYPRFQQHTTVSGRYSGDLQQLNRPIPRSELDKGNISPRLFKFNNVIRKFFISDEGYRFVDTDYESLEPHVFAHVSGDEGLKNIFRNKQDFYSTIAIMTERLEGVSADKKAPNYLGKVDPLKRQSAKEYSLGVPYGKSAYALSFSLNCSEREAQLLWNGYLNAFPDLAAWMDRSKQQCLTEGLIRVESGRVRHMKEAPKLYAAFGEVLLEPLKLYDKYHENPGKYKQMKFLASKLRNLVNNSRNIQIQGLAASITNRAAIAINRAMKSKGWDAQIVAQIHDQLILSVPSEHAAEAAQIMQHCMENTYKLSIDLKAPPAIARNFYEGH